MAEKSVIIIGAGLAGLSTGCFAQMNGYRSQIFEHHCLPGGVAAAWKRQDYLIDGGIHFIMGHKPGTGLHKLYRELGILPTNRFVDMTTYGWLVDEKTGRSLEVTQDLDRLAHDLKAHSPDDVQIVDGLIAGARAMQGLDLSEVGLAKPPEIAGPLDQIKEMWAMRHLLKYVVGRFGQSVADYTQAVQDPWLGRVLENLFLPDVPVYFVCMILAMLADGQLGYIEGGSLDFVRAIEKHYRDLGGQATYRATVEEILVRDDRAVGVRLVDGTEHQADAIVSACDGYSTIFKMHGGRYVNQKIRDRYAQWPRFRPLLMINYGVATEFPDQPTFAAITLQHPLSIGDKSVESFFVRTFNYSPRFAPPGKTVVQVEMDTDWDFWNELQRDDRARYEAEKQRIASEVLARLAAHYPGISSKVEVTDVATPYTFWRYTLNDKGAWEGWLMTAETLRTSVERTLPGLKDFYMAGQWVMPGGGVPSCLYSGRHAVQLLCKQDGRPFSTAPV
jgi:phytoene desaturase